VSCLFFDTRVHILTTKSLNDTLQGAFEAIVFFVAKKIACFFPGYKLLFEFSNG
jgi:hypothetical protein